MYYCKTKKEAATSSVSRHCAPQPDVPPQGGAAASGLVVSFMFLPLPCFFPYRSHSDFHVLGSHAAARLMVNMKLNQFLGPGLSINEMLAML